MDRKRQVDKAVTQQGPLLSTEARLVEVILFLENEPVSLERLSKMTALSEETTGNAIEELQAHYREYLQGPTHADIP
ncbi:MAG: SMC-Scp complex subunit ScpB, partial [Sphaerochaetaceae bacterium]